MKNLTIPQLNINEINLETFFKNLQRYGEIKEVIEKDKFTHEKVFIYKSNYFHTSQSNGVVTSIVNHYNIKPNI